MRTVRWAPLVAVLAVVAALVTALLVVAEPMQVHAGSMEPTLHSGQPVLVVKVGARASHPVRGEIVALRVPDGHELVVKRVVGIAGDSVAIEDGVLVVDGRRTVEGFVDYAATDTAYFGPVEVPAGTVFVLGDNRAHSVDSRVFGPVPIADVIGRVVGS